MRGRLTVTTIVLFTLVSVCVLASGFYLVKAQNPINVEGPITSNLTWGAATYNFTGNITVPQGITLTINPGARIELNTYYLLIDGTLIAKGTSTEKISIEAIAPNPNPDRLNPGGIHFSNSSTSWSEQTGDGSIIENAQGSPVFLSIDGVSPKIDENSGYFNIEVGLYSPTFYTQTMITNNASPLICDNNFFATIGVASANSPIIRNNTIEGGISFMGQNRAIVNDNTIRDTAGPGIEVQGGTPVIQNNLITNALMGIEIDGNTSLPVIENNTIKENGIGLNVCNVVHWRGVPGGTEVTPIQTLTYNNFEGNTQYNIFLGKQDDFDSMAPSVNASNNWWGTTDTSAIGQTIYDHKNNNNVGTVTYTPVLEMPNSQAAPNANLPPITPSPTTTPNTSLAPSSSSSSGTSGVESSSNSSPDLETAALILLSIVIVGLIAAIAFMRRKNK